MKLAASPAFCSQEVGKVGPIINLHILPPKQPLGSTLLTIPNPERSGRRSKIRKIFIEKF
jgi:hypothetical protein